MAFYHGYQGSVRFHATGGTPAVLATVTSWSLSIQKEKHPNTKVGDTYESFVGGLISATGTLELLYDNQSPSIIFAVNRTEDPGNAAFELYLDTAGNKKISFSGLIDSAEYGAGLDDVQRIRCSFVTNGALSMSI